VLIFLPQMLLALQPRMKNKPQRSAANRAKG
jgi:hypothetical protein